MSVSQTRTKATTRTLLRRISRLERQGKYTAALDLISEDWRQEGFVPFTESLGPREGTELLTRFGSLIGFAGHLAATTGAQERSRDILMVARTMAFALEDEHLSADCENSLALTYWRTGEHREAEVWLSEASARTLPRACDARLFSHVVTLLVNLPQGRHAENVEIGRAVENDFRTNGDPFLLGNLYSNIGISLKNLSRPTEALSYLTLARNYFEQARHWLYATAVENNLALLHKNERQFAEAHIAVDSAIARYKKLKDRSREGSSLETKAQIYVAEGLLDEAMTTIVRSINILRKGENRGYLAESVATKAKIHIASDDLADGMLALAEAIDITRTHAGEPAARTMAAEFQALLEQKGDRATAKAPSPTGGDLELMIPASLPENADYRGVWVHTSCLAEIGIERGSLALIVNETPVRGEPVAIMINETQEVACGYYDAEFGMIGLDGDGRDPMLFSEDDVKILGKIVGICRKEKTPDGRMIVEPIQPS